MAFKSEAKSRAWAHGWEKRLLNFGWTNTEIVNWLIDHSAGYRRQTMFADLNRLRAERVTAETIPGLSADLPIPENVFSVFLGNTAHQYRAILELRAVDVDTGEETSRHITLQFDNRPSQNDVIERYSEVREKVQDDSHARYILGDIKRVEYARNEDPSIALR